MVARWTFLGSLSQPKIHSPRNVDSTKKAASASMASGAPKTSPTKREYSLQFIPNWNSCTMPVATPIAKLISRSLPKNFVRRSQRSSPVRYPEGLHQCDERGEADRQRDEDEVVDRRDAELPPGEVEGIHEAP